jgi:hypothetical protein
MLKFSLLFSNYAFVTYSAGMFRFRPRYDGGQAYTKISLVSRPGWGKVENHGEARVAP